MGLNKQILLMGLASVPMSGCLDRGTPVTAEQAVSHFQTHRQSYEQIVALVERCRPERSGTYAGYNRVSADGSSAEGLHCGRDGQLVEPIVEALRRAEATSVAYSTADSPAPLSPESPMRSVAISVYSAGLAVSGTMTQFVYSFQPLATPPVDEGDASSGVSRKVVTGPPYHWWWERSY